MMKIKFLLFCVANTVLVASSSYKDEAIKKWPFCDFKEGGFEHIYKHLQLKEKPKSPLYCSMPFYEWHSDRPPVFEGVSSEMTFILDPNGDDVDVIATFWSNGKISPSGATWQVILEGAEQIDFSKYSLCYFVNSRLDMEGLFFKAKYPEDENLIYVRVCMLCKHMEEETLMTEKSFLVLWNEHIQGRGTLKCHLDSDSDSDYAIEL